jgi:arginine repressor
LGEVPSLGHSSDPDRRRVAEDVFGVELSGDTIMVLHTPPGESSAVGPALDWPAWGDILGTIAVDDAIFVAVKDAAAQRGVTRELKKRSRRPKHSSLANQCNAPLVAGNQ